MRNPTTTTATNTTTTTMQKKKKKKKTIKIIATQNNNYIKAKIVNTQQNRKCRLRDDGNECNKLAQKEYKSRHDGAGNVICWELCKRLKLDHVVKWYMHKHEFGLEKMRHIKFSETEL